MTQYWLDLIEVDPVLYPEETLKQLSLESGHIGEAASIIISRGTAIAEGYYERPSSSRTVADTGPARASDSPAIQHRPAVKGVISKIKSCSTTRDGLKNISFKVGPHSCFVYGKVAEFVERNSFEYEGKLLEVYGDWKINHRARPEFVLAESIPATQPDSTGEVTADNVQRALEEALVNASDLRSVGGPTHDEMRAEYEAACERKRAEQQTESSAAAA